MVTPSCETWIDAGFLPSRNGQFVEPKNVYRMTGLQETTFYEQESKPIKQIYL